MLLFVASLRPQALKQCIDKGSYRTALCEDNQSTKQQKYDDYGKEPIPLSILQELPEF